VTPCGVLLVKNSFLNFLSEIFPSSDSIFEKKLADFKSFIEALVRIFIVIFLSEDIQQIKNVFILKSEFEIDLVFDNL
jgi:hypothetical protein